MAVRDRRAVTPAVGISLLVVVSVILAAVVGAMAFGFDIGDTPPHASISAEATYNTDDRTHISLTHVSGDELDAEELTIRVFVNGEPLKRQPSIPATGMNGFFRMPDGPFRADGDSNWTAGEVAGFTIARTTNAPQPSPGDRIVVRVIVENAMVSAPETTVDQQ